MRFHKDNVYLRYFKMSLRGGTTKQPCRVLYTDDEVVTPLFSGSQ